LCNLIFGLKILIFLKPTSIKIHPFKNLNPKILPLKSSMMKVDDEISKSVETIVHLNTQIEEAKRVEELLKNQINEKEESCDKLEAEVVDLRNKADKSNKFLNSSQS
jgi:uncharacterized protein Yka (UPF0111/DUF47 family)